MTGNMLEAALGYAARGWKVFPLHNPVNDGCSCGKPHDKPGKHPRTPHGHLDATCDAEVIRDWWYQWPTANIGVRTGVESNLVVIDLDGDGIRTFADLASRYGGLPDTLQAVTGNGTHFYFEHPRVSVKCTESELAEHVDVRGDGGYIIAAPSHHYSGRNYEWVNDLNPAWLPSWLLTLLVEGKKTLELSAPADPILPAPGSNPFTDAPIITEGTRNVTLYKLGCALRGKQGMEHGQIVSILLEYNDAKCEPPLGHDEVLTIAGSACQHPKEIVRNKSQRRMEQCPLYWFPFNTREWLTDQDVIMMTDMQRGWYISLWVHAWQNGGFLPTDPNVLCKLAGAKSQRLFNLKCQLVLAKVYEVEVDGQCKLKDPGMAQLYVSRLAVWMTKTNRQRTGPTGGSSQPDLQGAAGGDLSDMQGTVQ